MKRRKFIILASTGTVITTLTSFKFWSTSFEEATVNLLVKELGFLKLDVTGVKKFAEDFGEDKGALYRFKLKSFSFMGLSATHSKKVQQIINLYLLSTDFFSSKMNENKPIKYIGLYNPYTRPCSNPFSHHYYPETV